MIDISKFWDISKSITVIGIMILVLSLSNLNQISSRAAYAVGIMDSPSIFPFKTGTSTTSTTNTLDKFGIKEIYLTKSGGEQWYMNMQNPTSDTRFGPHVTLTKNSDGSYKITSNKVRLEVYTSSGYHPDKITTYNQQQLSAKGYMQSPNDWKNVEMTGIVKLISSPSDDNFAWYNRGGVHTDSKPCEGVGYKGDIMYFFSGKTRFAKEQWHSGGYSFTPLKTVSSSIQGKWVGLKYIVYNFQQNGKTVVKVESWFDANNNGNWAKINEFVDTRGWGNQGTYCGGTPDQLITWGGPIATFRWDTATNVSIKNFSVREIQPPL
jgi:hypothetical protein